MPPANWAWTRWGSGGRISSRQPRCRIARRSASRTTVIGGTALWLAADKVIAKGKKIAARMLEAAEADIVFSGGRFTVVGTQRAVAVREVARTAFQPAKLPPGLEPGFYETGTFSPPAETFPNGCHVCELEIDET